MKEGTRYKKAEKRGKRMLKAGTQGYQELVVAMEDTALAAGSGGLRVLATPVMSALMEKACWKSAADQLGEGEDTVGTSLSVRHVAATPVGMKVWCKSCLTQVEGRKLTFHVEAYDEAGLIGTGEHERVLIQVQRFQEKADAKRKLEKGKE